MMPEMIFRRAEGAWIPALIAHTLGFARGSVEKEVIGMFTRTRSRTAPAEIGWALMPTAASLIWDAPSAFDRKVAKPQSAKSVQLCPAAIDFDARNIVVSCPVDLHLRFDFDPKGQPHLVNIDGPQSTVRSTALNQMLTVVARNEWRHPDRPIIQIVTPYVFLSDTPAWLNQFPPFLDYGSLAMPGLMIGGRFPVHIWPRQLMWAFEWHDVTQPLKLRRGQPWFYLRFDTPDPDRIPRLVEAVLVPDVKAYIDSLSGVANYVNRTFALFSRAQHRRPERMLVKA